MTVDSDTTKKANRGCGIILVAILVFISLLFLQECGQTSIRNSPTNIPIPQNTPIAAPTQKIDTPSVNFRIVAEEDVSSADAVRLQFRIAVDHLLTESQMQQVCVQIIESQKATRPHNAISFVFYLTGTDIRGPYTAGRAIWAPDGIWEKAREVSIGDYSRHRLAIESLGSAITNLPTPKPTIVGLSEDVRKQIFYDLVLAQDRGMEYRQAKSSVAQKYGISEQVVGEILSEGLRRSWPMPTTK